MLGGVSEDSHASMGLSSTNTTSSITDTTNSGRDEHAFGPGHDRKSSVDMALELERQLDAEHESEIADSTSSPDVSPDPLILANIVTNLRQALDEMTSDRDRLSEVLSDTQMKEAELREGLALVTGKCSALEEELTLLRLKSNGDDETINILRSKVEESRRGVMRLQSENKRMSQLSIDSNRANAFFGSTPSSSKRASFVPLTGSGRPHRRTVSVAENSFPPEDLDSSMDTSGLRSPSLFSHDEHYHEDNAAAKKNRRASGFLTGTRPSSSSPSRSPPRLSPEPPIHNAATQVEHLDREEDSLLRLKAELEATKHELRDAQDAREASEFCVRALRTFISEHTSDGGEVKFSSTGTIKLPALPTDKTEDENAPMMLSPSMAATKSLGGWSLKLWRSDSEKSTSSTKLGSVLDSTAVSPASEAPSNPLSAAAASPSATASMTLSKKLGVLFASRKSYSGASPSQESPHAPSSHSHAQEPMLNGSDCSSIDEASEPVSPVAMASTNRVTDATVLVRDGSNDSAASTTSTAVGGITVEHVITAKSVTPEHEDEHELTEIPITGAL